jgi:hypothetical protein
MRGMQTPPDDRPRLPWWGLDSSKVPHRAFRHCAVGYVEALKRIDIRLPYTGSH